jgi:hypothetical protein
MLFVSVFDALLRRKLEGLLPPYCRCAPSKWYEEMSMHI